MDRKPLFRPEATRAHGMKWTGDIIVAQPISIKFFVFFAILFLILTLVFLFFGHYTTRSGVQGRLVTDRAIIKVYPDQLSTVLEKRVSDGAAVRKGDVLYVLTSERQSSGVGYVQERISSQIGDRQQALKSELERTIVMQKGDRLDIRRKIEGKRAELDILERQIEGQIKRNTFAEKNVTRHADLLAQKFISSELFQQKQDDYLDHLSKLQGLQREKSAQILELNGYEHELVSLPSKQNNEISVLRRTLTHVVIHNSAEPFAQCA